MADYLSQAKQYLRQRLSAELSFQNNLETLIDEYASKLVDIAYQSNVPPNLFTFSYNKAIRENVDKVIGEMRQLIESVTETLAVGAHGSDRKKILAYMGRDIGGDNFYGRLDSHTRKFRKEMEGVIAASILIGVSSREAKEALRKYLRAPYQNPIFREAASLGKGRAEVLVAKGLHLGAGMSNSAFNSFNTLGKFTVADAWMRYWYDDWDSRGAIGYSVMRGSSYPCSLCDTNTGFHTDGNLPPYHPSCCCIAIPVFGITRT